MSAPASFASPQLVSLRTISTQGGETFELHSHPFLEFTLVTDDDCVIDCLPRSRKAGPNTLFHYHAGERHGAHGLAEQQPRYWVVHFHAGHSVYQQLPRLSGGSPSDRVWNLQPEQAEMFQWMFLQLLNERSAKRPHRELSTSAWLQLLLVSIERWAERSSNTTTGIPTRANPEVIRLWHQINESVSKPNEELAELYSAPNYDSVRHAFRKSFGCSPREMLQRLRLEHAKNLLLESSLSIKEIAARVGYTQQHDFNRMFHRFTGMAPSHWRDNPTVRSVDE